jgi:hypothetical protein
MADDLVAECRQATEKGTLQRLVNRWSRPDILSLMKLDTFRLMN